MGRRVSRPTCCRRKRRRSIRRPRPAGAGRCSSGQMNVVTDTGTSFMIQFESGHDLHFDERPQDMMRAPRSPQEMRYEELVALHRRRRAVGDRREHAARGARAQDRRFPSPASSSRCSARRWRRAPSAAAPPTASRSASAPRSCSSCRCSSPRRSASRASSRPTSPRGSPASSSASSDSILLARVRT